MEAANHRLDAVCASIRKTPAKSFAGLKAKARVARDDAMDKAMALSLVDDLCAFSEVQS